MKSYKVTVSKIKRIKEISNIKVFAFTEREAKRIAYFYAYNHEDDPDVFAIDPTFKDDDVEFDIEDIQIENK